VFAMTLQASDAPRVDFRNLLDGFRQRSARASAF
jgi:hypothetical protein